uniref:Uncharacterized LOC113122645 n=1 Tax=Mastacembelus armatus TaxID=205130 RepID=A0A7N8Y4B6_9TELE
MLENLQCARCLAHFNSKLSLRAHQKLCIKREGQALDCNTGPSETTGPFQCNKCGKQFFNHCVLQRHQIFNPRCQSKSEPELDSDSAANSSTRFSCQECSKTFAKGSFLAAHYESQHGEVLEIAHPQGDALNSVDQVSEQVDVSLNGTESMLALKPKAHQCPLCSLTFAKARGLRAHKWQAHSKGAKGKNKVPLSKINVSVASSSEIKKTEDSSPEDNTTTVPSYLVETKDVPVGSGKKKIRPDLKPVKFVSCLDCGTLCSSPGALIDHRKVCLEVKQESTQEVLTPEVSVEVSPTLGRVSEHSIKFLFKCGKCGKAFQTEEQLGIHKTKAKTRPYCCALCCHGFWTENQLQQHLVWHDEVRCRLPNEVRYRLSAVMTSKPVKAIIPSANHGGKSFQSSTLPQPAPKPDCQSLSSHKCQHCGKAFLSPTALQKHETQHSSPELYHCSVCPRTFSEIQDLIAHHQECVGKYKRQIDCPECGMSFVRRTRLLSHLRVHRLHKPLRPKIPRCDQCNKGFTSVKSWIAHIDLHKEKPFWCLVCAKGFRDEESLDKHLQGHSLRQHKCDICQKRFQTSAHLMNHYTTHSRAKPYQCSYCGRSFSQARNLISHRNTHLKAFAGFNRKSLMAHQKAHTEKKPFKCPICGQAFNKSSELTFHKKVHFGRDGYACTDCGKPCKTLTLLKYHRRTHTGERPYVCKECGKRFTMPKALQKHIASHLPEGTEGDEGDATAKVQLKKNEGKKTARQTIILEPITPDGQLEN